MRPSFPDLMHGLFWLALSVILVLGALRAFAMMDRLEQRMQQGTLHHEKLMEMADKSLAMADQLLAAHAAFLVQQDAIMHRQRLAR